MKEYDIDFLIEQFSFHDEEIKKGSQYKKNDFHISRALKLICEEIKSLKESHETRNYP